MLLALFSSPPVLPLAFLTPTTALAVLVVGLLIFGRRLPEVGKNLGRTIVEFKKGLGGATSTDAEEPEEPEEPKRLSSREQKRVTASKAARKRLPERQEETEEV